MKPKRFKPVRVIDPVADYHTVHVNPRQGIALKLRAPFVTLKNCSEGAVFEVTILSDFLLLGKETKEEKGNVYSIEQKYNLEDWQEYGEVSLGEITITVKNNTHPQAKKFRTTLCIIQTSGNDKVLTVVNPQAHVVKMEPKQILEVVCFESAWNNWEPRREEADGFHDAWYWENRKVELKIPIGITEVKKEIAADRSDLLEKETGVFSVKNRFHLKVNPHLSDSDKTVVEQELKISHVPVREHHFWFICTEESLNKIGKLPDDVYPVSFMDFHGNCPSTNGENHTAWRGLDLLLNVKGKNKNNLLDTMRDTKEPTKRYESTMLLTNPLSMEIIDFNQQNQEIIIEIVQPSAFWQDLDDGERWNMEIKRGNDNLAVELLADMTFLHKRFQRFRVSCIYKLSEFSSQETVVLGAIHLVCKPKEYEPEGCKHISFYLEPTTRKIYSEVVKVENNKKSKSGLQVCEVEFEELNSACLETDAQTRRAADVITKTNFCGFYPKEEAKKKESWTWDSQTATNSTSSTALLGVGLNESRKNLSGFIAEKEEGGTIKSITIYDPHHLHEIVLEQGQALNVRMSVPSKRFAACTSEFWSLMVSGHIKIKHWKTIKLDDEIYQEARIVTEQIQPLDGIQPIGSLCFGCSVEQRKVSVKVSAEADKVELKPTSVVCPQKCMTGLGGQKTYINEWGHNDWVIISPEESVFLRSPDSPSWDAADWQMEIEQFPLLDKIWKHSSLKSVLKNVDVYNPWFKTFCPLQIGNAYIIRPLTIQQPFIKSLLEVAASELTQEYLPIVKITFRNKKQEEDKCTTFGIYTKVLAIERTLILCIRLKHEIVSLVNPLDEQEIELKSSQILTVRLTPRQLEIERESKLCPWYSSSIPKFLEWRGTEQDGADHVFTFRVMGGYNEQKDVLSFMCGNVEKAILVKI